MNPEDGPSPWRNAKPRKPLSDYQTPGGKSPNIDVDVSSLSDEDLYQQLFQLGVEVGPIVASTRNLYRKKLEQALNGKTPQSPPNSGYKESTRMETSMDSPASTSLKMDLSGASPALFRGGEEKLGSQTRSSKANSSRSKQASFTKIKNTSRTPLQKKNKSSKKADNSDSEDSSEVEDDQPSGSCQFVGESSMASNMSSSTINNTMGSTASRRKGNNSIRQLSVSASSPATTSTAPLSPPPVSKTNSFCSCLGWVFVLSLAMLVYAVTFEGGRDHMLLSTTPHEPAQHWKQTKDLFRSDLRSLTSKFPNQTSATWKMISATLKSPMNSLPDYPGVLLLLSNPSSLATANCLATKLVELSSKSFSKPGLVPPPPNQLVIPAPSLPSLDPHTAKEQLTSLLHTSLSSWGATAITSLHLLHPIPALTLHAFADNSNAPYKQAVLILSLSGEEDSPGSIEKRAENVLAKEWSKELGEDKLYALISRLVVSVAEVQKEEGEVLVGC